jgi:hypothetical protein
MSGRQFHRTGVFVLSTAMLAIGVALVVEAFASSSAFSGRLLMGVLFAAAGVGRFYVEVRRGRRAP